MAPVTLISSLPSYSSVEEHANIVGSTPASFSDIPPVLKYHESNVSVRLEPLIEGFTESEAQNGELYVLTSVLVFMSATGHGFQRNYPDIILHAISREREKPEIYCQLDTGDAEPEGDEEIDVGLQELSIIPQNATSLELIFESLSHCAALHPDSNTEEDDDAGEAAYLNGEATSPFETFTGDEQEELSQVGRAALAHLESIIYDPQNLLNNDEDFSNPETDEDEEVGRGVETTDTKERSDTKEESSKEV